jgi:hypothetical protein
MNTPERDEILRRFAEWLDGGLSREEAPAGIPEDILAGAEEPSGGDLYSVQAALTALTQEVKLQGRGFKQLAEAVAPALAPLAEQARHQAREEVLDVLLDLRDRLARGEEAARTAVAGIVARKRWWRRTGDGRAVAIATALQEGYELTSTRLAEALENFGVREIECLGSPFDVRRMDAIAIDESGRAADGVVVEVLRRGYEWDEAVYRPAQVRVARRIDRS